MTRGHLAMFLLSGVATLYVILRVPLPFSLVSRQQEGPGAMLGEVLGCAYFSETKISKDRRTTVVTQLAL